MGNARFALPVETSQELLLDLAGERALAPLLARVVNGLAGCDDVALARIWLVRPGDVCTACPMRHECETEVPCLHLVVSAGRSIVSPDADWSRTTGEFRRIPIGKRKVGSVASTTEPIRVEDARVDSRWIARPDWARNEHVLGFGGQPLVHHGEVLGVLGLFTRSPFGESALRSLRVIADHVAAAIANARAFELIADLKRRLEAENEYLRDEVSEPHAAGQILGVSLPARHVDEQVRQVAPTDASVLILGESGTGKELVAREIHRRSRRAARPMIRVNCASIARDLYESEFFGHSRGAFTGAIRDRVGRFAAADGGTLFLDEVSEIPPELQAKLLRVLQEGQYERVGEDRTRSVDVRIVAATNRALLRDVRAGRFREDLYYRLNVFPIEVPPLRRRPEDIPLLAEAFLATSNRKLKRRARLSEADLDRLRGYPWPGNVRELQNVIERAVITSKAGKLDLHLPAHEGPQEPGDSVGRPTGRARPAILREAEIRRLEIDNLVAALVASRWKIYGPGGAAERLGVKPTTLASRVQRLGLRRADAAHPASEAPPPGAGDR